MVKKIMERVECSCSFVSYSSKYQEYRIYFDNYFNFIGLQISLYKQEIISLGSKNRLPNCQLPNDTIMSRKRCC